MEQKKMDISIFGILCYMILPLACMGNYVVTSYISIFWTDYLGISVAVVGGILLFSRLFDGVTDLIMGIFIDKTKTRFGKAKPWLFIGLVGTVISSIALFINPNFGMTAKIVYCAFMYIMVVAIFGTMTSVSTTSLINLTTKDPEKRFTMSSLNFVFMFCVIMLVSFGVALVDVLGGDANAWFKFCLICNVVSIIFIIICWLGIKELDVEITSASEELVAVKKKESLKSTIKDIIGNKYFFFVMGNYFIVNIWMAMTNGVGIYYATYILGDANYFALLTSSSMIALMAGTALAPVLSKKIGISRLVVIGNSITAITMIMAFFVARNPIAVAALLAIGQFTNGPGSAVLMPYCAMAADYGEYTTGIARPGVYSGASSIGTKVGTGVGGAIFGAIMAVAGYSGMAEVQTAGAEMGIILCYIIIPAVTVIISTLLCVPFFKLEKEHDNIVKTNLERREQAGKM